MEGEDYTKVWVRIITLRPEAGAAGTKGSCIVRVQFRAWTMCQDLICSVYSAAMSIVV